MTDRKLSHEPDVLAPDGSEVRILASCSRGSMAQFRLHPDQISMAVAHHTVDEIWFVTAGQGRLWRKQGHDESITELAIGMSLVIPIGTHFQFRCDGDVALEIIGATMPPWPGENEAYVVAGKW